MSQKQSYTWSDKLFLIVDDDPASAMLLEIILSKTGAKLLIAESGEKAVDIVNRTRGIDLILMDIKMSGVNGLDATTLIKEIAPHIPIIAQTACVVIGDKEKCLLAGCSAYIPKPIISENLLSEINHQLSSVISFDLLRKPFCTN